ncbi:MAG: hypothetical protein CSA04_02395 [Bacteroidetes bacterium]|nr:MAG: hypothetical protein CSA04_02395 [Bacteroidota bacterium]
MRKIHFLTLLAVLGIGLVFTSCKDKDKPKDPVSVNTITIDATAYDAWVYFSFKEGEVVEVADFATSTAWDIGFHRYDLRVNGGEAGPGEGGTFATGENNFAAVTTAPESGYVSNDFIDVAVDVTVMPPVMEHVPGDQVLATWVTMTYGQQGPKSLW